MTNLYQAQLRAANFYLTVLREAGALYDQGGEALRRGLERFEKEWANIKLRQSWVEEHSSEDEKVAVLCSSFPDAAPRLLDLRQHPRERIQWLEAALSAARRLKDQIAEGKHLNGLGLAYLRLGEAGRALELLQSSLAILNKVGDRRAEGEVLCNIGYAYVNLGAPVPAIHYSERALSVVREHQDFRNEGIALCNLGQSFYLMREFHRAIRFYEESLTVTRKIGYLLGENIALNFLGETYAILNKLEEAIAFFDQALSIAREIGDRHGQRNALRNLGQAYHDLNQIDRAIELYEAAFGIARDIGDHLVELELLNNLGETYLDAGDDAVALSYYKQRLDIKKEMGWRRAADVEDHFYEGALQNIVNVTDDKQAAEQVPAASQRVTWLHISDIHFRQSDSHQYDENIVIESLLDDIEERIKEDGLKPDFIAVTGDLAFSGQPSEYELVRAFFDKLLGITGLSLERLFIVPGNHDVDWNLITPLAKDFSFKEQMDRQAIKSVLDSPDDRHRLFARFKWYANFFNEYFKDQLDFNDTRYFYTHVLDIGGRRVAILGLNSAWLSVGDEDERLKLVIGEQQTRAALRSAKEASADLKIALLHHPYDWIKGFDQSDSMEPLIIRCDFILHGHLHKAATTQLSTPDGSAIIIAGGACYETRDYPNSYNFVRLDFETNRGTIYFREYVDKREGFWTKAVRLYKNVPDGMYEFALPFK